MTRHIKRLSGTHTFTLPADEDGYVGRECPACEAYFKIVNGTGLRGENLPCHCAYCGHSASHDEFHTKEQIAYAKSLLHRMAQEAVYKDLKEMFGRQRRPQRKSLISISFDVKRPHPVPIRRYCEKELEEHGTCSNCTLKYAVYGTFAFCPDCRAHNSEQILAKNFDLFEQMLDLAGTQAEAIAERLVIDALQDAVAAFDGFGRESVRVRAAAATTNPPHSVSFQNLRRAQQRLQTLFGFDLSGALPPADWELAHRTFQKRHVFAHAMGVVDQDYLDKTGDPTVVLGQKLTVTAPEVRTLLGWLRQLGTFLVASLP